MRKTPHGRPHPTAITNEPKPTHSCTTFVLVDTNPARIGRMGAVELRDTVRVLRFAGKHVKAAELQLRSYRGRDP